MGKGFLLYFSTDLVLSYLLSRVTGVIWKNHQSIDLAFLKAQLIGLSFNRSKTFQAQVPVLIEAVMASHRKRGSLFVTRHLGLHRSNATFQTPLGSQLAESAGQEAPISHVHGKLFHTASTP